MGSKNGGNTMHIVSEAAALSGLTVRALHHYDEIGLLQPSAHSDAGYRLYSNDDIQVLRRIRRYQALGFSLGEIRELLAASASDRLAALQNQRDTIRSRASETAGIVRAINREIDMESGNETEPSDRLGRAGALVRQYLDRLQSEPVSQASHLLVEALDLLRPLTTSAPMNPAAVHLANWIHGHRHDWANVADLAQRFLDQDPSSEHHSVATPELITALTLLKRHEDAVAAHRKHIEDVMEHRPATEWADAMWNSTHTWSWSETGKHAEWIELFQAIDAGIAATTENRASRYELLHTAAMLMGSFDYESHADDIDALTQRMADIIGEDPDWSERLWADQRFQQQKVGNAIRRGNPDAVTETVDAYRSFLRSCDWPDERIGTAYSNLGAMMHWEGRHELAVECFVQARRYGELDGYGYAWFASASLGAGAPRERAIELLHRAGGRLESADAMRIFNEDAVLSADKDNDDLVDALLLVRA